MMGKMLTILALPLLAAVPMSVGFPANLAPSLPDKRPDNGAGGSAITQPSHPAGTALGDKLALSPVDAIAVNLARKIDAAPGIAPAFHFARGSADLSRALDCMTAAVYYEAGDDPTGQRAVAQVVLNRARNPNYPSSVCGVVFQGHKRSTGCQFTFTCDGSLARIPDRAGWLRAREVALASLSGAVDRQVGAATHYHADYVVPYWASELTKVAVVGRHIFYRSYGSDSIRSTIAQAPEPQIDRGPAEPALLAVAEHGSLMPTTVHTAGISAVSPAVAELQPATAARQAMQFLLTDSAAPSGRFAVAALGLCKGQAGCRVLGYGSEKEIDTARVAGAVLPRPLFIFVRDAGTGMEIAVWDCAKLKRSSAQECLPASQAALERLMLGPEKG